MTVIDRGLDMDAWCGVASRLTALTRFSHVYLPQASPFVLVRFARFSIYWKSVSTMNAETGYTSVSVDATRNGQAR